jgi:hypothetical protein
VSSSDRPAGPAPWNTTVELVARARDALTQIYVIDARFQVVAQGVGTLQVRVPAGLYKVKFKAGHVFEEVDAALAPGSPPLEVLAGRFMVSAAPLRGTGTSYEHHANAARKLSHTSTVSAGAGASLMVFARDLRRDPPPLHEHPLARMGLHGEDGAPIFDGGTAPFERGASWAGFGAAVAPGIYRLRLDRPSGTVEHAIYTYPGWQSQVFLVLRETADGLGMEPQLGCSTIIMAPAAEGFTPDDKDLRLTELARQSLEQRRVMMREDLIESLLAGERDNPMLALYAAHLLLLQREPAWAVLRRLLSHLERLLPASTDVAALRLKVQEDGGPTPLSAPPMLRASWKIIAERSLRWPELLLPGSLLARIMNRTVLGDGATLCWRAPDEGRESASSDEDPSPALSDAAEVWQMLLALDLDPDEEAERSLLTPIEHFLLVEMDRRRRRPVSRSFEVTELGVVLGLSPAAAAGVVVRLGRKLLAAAAGVRAQ